MFDLATETSGVDQHLYLRPAVIEEAGKKIGMVPAAKYEELLARCQKLEERLVGVEEVASSIERFKDAAANINGLTSIKKPAAKVRKPIGKVS